MSRPNKNNAISNLVSGVAWSMKGEEISHWDINNVGIAQPTDEAINTELTRLQTDYDNKKYQRDRAKEYPSIVDQLDDIYHNGIDGWKATIKTTKDKYPKE